MGVKNILSTGIWFQIAPVDTHARRAAKLAKQKEYAPQRTYPCICTDT